MRFQSLWRQSDSCGRHSSLLIFCTHITFWGLSMETQQPSSKEEERLKNEIATLRKRIQILVAEVDRLRRKMESTWGEA
jgi:cell division protein FtsB